MLRAATLPRPPAALRRLTATPARRVTDDFDWHTPIDRSRWFFCETLTPLYYAPIYRELAPDHRRRYNQLTGMLANELISLLESEFLDAALTAVATADPADSELREAVIRFRDDEARHADAWDRLNRLSEPGWYQTRQPRLVTVSAPVRALSRFIARHPLLVPVVFWVQLVQEERSVEISRRCMRVDGDRIEPRYAGVYAAHLHDEVRHVQIDRHLIERFYRPRSPAVRHVTARLLRGFVSRLLLTPGRSSFAVVRRLVEESPELAPLESRIRAELRRLTASDEYHRMMYSRESTPVTFDLFDRFEEFHQMQHVLRAYRPRPVTQS